MFLEGPRSLEVTHGVVLTASTCILLFYPLYCIAGLLTPCTILSSYFARVLKYSLVCL